MTFMFRLPFRLAETQRIGIQNESISLLDEDGRRVELRGEGADLVAQTDTLSIRGYGYSTSTEARADGHRWRAAVTAGLLQFHIGADFRDREPPTYYNPELLSHLSAEVGVVAQPDQPGVSVVEGSDVVFMKLSATPLATHGFVGGTAVIADNYRRRTELDASAHLAFDLYSGYYRFSSTDSRFLTLTMAIEALTDLRQIVGPKADALAELKEFARELDLDERDKNSLLGQLSNLSRESVGESCRRLIAAISEPGFDHRAATTLFKHCYEMRSRLVHGSAERPPVGDLEAVMVPLLALTESLVSSCFRNGG